MQNMVLINFSSFHKDSIDVNVKGSTLIIHIKNGYVLFKKPEFLDSEINKELKIVTRKDISNYSTTDVHTSNITLYFQSELNEKDKFDDLENLRIIEIKLKEKI